MTGPVEGKVILEDETYAKSTIGPTTATEGKSVKVLGVNWNTGTDELFKFNDKKHLCKVYTSHKVFVTETDGKDLQVCESLMAFFGLC